MKIIDLLNELRESLPVHQLENTEFIDNVENLQKQFIDKIKQIDENDLKLFLPKSDKYLTKKMLLFRFERITSTLIEILDNYYKGFPDEAYKGLKKLFRNVSFISNLSDVYEGFFLIKDLSQFDEIDYYRLREIKRDETEVPFAKDLFHAPFERRGNVKTSRFSIPGFPCLYLGRSLEVCCLETMPKEYIFASRFEIIAKQTHTRPLNLTIPETFTDSIYDMDNENNYDAFCFLLTYPVIQICLFEIKKECANDNFKPEYIVPQLLLQYVRKEGFFNGILYTSTKVTDNKSDEMFQNLVLPVQQIHKVGYCSTLKKNVKVTQPISINNTTNEELILAEKKLSGYQVESIKLNL